MGLPSVCRFPRGSSLGVCLLVAISVGLTGCARSPGGHPVARAGVIDLRDWDFQRQGPVRLDGEWEMRWGELPGQAPSSAAPAAPTYFRIPDRWDQQERPEGRLPAQGHATFRLRVLLNPSQERLAVRILHSLTAYALTVDGHPVAANGVVGTSAETSAPAFAPGVFLVPTLGQESAWTFAVSNYHYGRGGPRRPIFLGTYEQLRNIRETNLILEQSVTGAVVLIALYHLVLLIHRRQERASLYFMLFCLVTAARQLTTEEQALLRLFPQVPWGVVIRVQLISWFWAISLAALFLGALYPAEQPRWWERATVAMAAVFTAMQFALPMTLAGSQVLAIYEVWTLVVMLTWIAVTARAAWHGREVAGWMLAGMVVFDAALLNDVLFHHLTYGSAYVAPLAVPPVLAGQALLLMGKFARALNTAESLQASLERKVEERTAELAVKNTELERTIGDLTATQSQLRKVGLPVQSGADVRVIPYADILYLSAHQGGTVIHTPHGEQAVPRPLKDIEAQLSPDVFLRIHRTCIVNVQQVSEVLHIANGGYAALLRGKTDATLPVSRYLADALKVRLGQAPG